MFGYSEEEVINMIEALKISYEIVDVPEFVDKGITDSIHLLTALYNERNK